VCVPISRLAECVLETRADVQNDGILAALVGHVGDGNFHLIFPLAPGDEEELQKAKEVNARLITRALAMGGTVSGEHGVGVGKMAYLEAEHGEALEVMKAIKRALDPENRMNPGKMVAI
jgi:D-lactate dehydrogenase (cytochrome)